MKSLKHLFTEHKEASRPQKRRRRRDASAGSGTQAASGSEAAAELGARLRPLLAQLAARGPNALAQGLMARIAAGVRLAELARSGPRDPLAPILIADRLADAAGACDELEEILLSTQEELDAAATEVLQRAQALLSTAWTGRALATDDAGRPVRYDDEAAARWSLAGGLARAADAVSEARGIHPGLLYTEAAERVSVAAGCATHALGEWDRSGVTAAEVLSLVGRAATPGR